MSGSPGAACRGPHFTSKVASQFVAWQDQGPPGRGAEVCLILARGARAAPSGAERRRAGNEGEGEASEHDLFIAVVRESEEGRAGANHNKEARELGQDEQVSVRDQDSPEEEGCAFIMILLYII